MNLMQRKKDKKSNNPNWRKVKGEWVAVPKEEQGRSHKRGKRGKK